MGYDEDDGEELDSPDMKECRYCGEQIRAAAIKCRHCGEHLKKRRGGAADASARKQIDDAATLALIMGIVGLVACCLTLPVAILKGNEAKRRALAAKVPVPGAATAGIVLGWGGIALNVIAALLGIVFFVGFALLTASPR